MRTISKGDKLEEALEFIEKKIIEENSSLKHADISIERKKIINIGGVKNELDLFVTVDPGNQYKSIFIFECKNWQKKINKNEIIVFQNKIKETNAQRGFFLGLQFTKDAQNQATKDGKTILLKVKDTTELNIFDPISTTTTIYKDYRNIGDFNIHLHNALNINISELIKNGESKNITFLGVKVSWVVFSKFFISNEIDKEINKKSIKPKSFKAGEYQNQFLCVKVFKRGELFIDKYEVNYIAVDIQFNHAIIDGELIYRFDIENKGNVSRKIFKLPNNHTMEIIYTNPIK